MPYLFDPRTWIAFAIVGVLILSHSFAYRSGRAAIRAEWDKDIAVRLDQALELEKANRSKEHQLVAGRQNAEVRYVEEKRKAVAAAAGAQSELDRLRSTLAAPDPGACSDPASAARADGGARLERELLGQGAQALVGLAAEADRLEAQVIGLQQYVNQVCLALMLEGKTGVSKTYK